MRSRHYSVADCMADTVADKLADNSDSRKCDAVDTPNVLDRPAVGDTFDLYTDFERSSHQKLKT